MEPGTRLFFSISFFSPRLEVWPRQRRPSFTMIRFSPWSFITSPTVAMAAISSMSSHSCAKTPDSSKSTCTSLNATIPPQIPVNGYAHPLSLGFTIASAGGSTSLPPSGRSSSFSSTSISWWSVTITVIPSFFALAIWLTAAIPLSHVSMVSMPSDAAASMIISLIPYPSLIRSGIS